MNIEKWMCNKCGSPCKVEIHFDSKGLAGDVQRFRGRCLAGTKDVPEDHTPAWRRQDTRKTKCKSIHLGKNKGEKIL